jgi:RP/EB family microtubule-associated protein
VERLSKAKYQDNLEFIQWLKRYYEVNGGEKSEEYNAEERRGNAKIDFSFA